MYASAGTLTNQEGSFATQVMSYTPIRPHKSDDQVGVAMRGKLRLTGRVPKRHIFLGKVPDTTWDKWSESWDHSA